jgi:hypothetical protein
METILNTLDEDTTTPNAIEIETTDENLSVDNMYQQNSLPSLGRMIFSVLPLSGPTGSIFNIKRNDANDGFKLVRADVEVENSAAIHTGITEEAIQDMRSQYGKNTNVIVGNLLKGLANDKENVDTLAFLELKSLSETTLVLTDSKNAESNMFEVTQKVQELVLKANSKNIRAYGAYCVLPYKVGAAVMALSKYADGDNSTSYALYIGKIGQTKYYMNPNPASDTAYVGIKSPIESKSSAVFSPYTNTIVNAINPDDGERTYHIYNRYAITASPLHEAGDEMLFKFDITL